MLTTGSQNSSTSTSGVVAVNGYLQNGHQRAQRLRTVRLGFLGLGWIGLNRLKSIAGAPPSKDGPHVEIAAVADPLVAAREAALDVAPGALPGASLEELLDADVDGIVIATPSGQHAAQVQSVLKRGLPAFCQKPLARTTRETYCLVNEARKQDRLLAVDFCYRHVAGVEGLRRLIHSGELGDLFAIDLTFHNAYGPNKQWARDIHQSGGGCVIDLATHLVDLALWMCGDRRASELSSRLYRQGRRLSAPGDEIEDTAFAEWLFDDEISVRLACSWDFSAGCDAEIRAAFYGSSGAAVLRNVNGSFYDFVAEHYCNSSREFLASPPDDWGGRALARWAERLAHDPTYDPDVERCCRVASLIDSIYGR